MRRPVEPHEQDPFKLLNELATLTRASLPQKTAAPQASSPVSATSVPSELPVTFTSEKQEYQAALKNPEVVEALLALKSMGGGKKPQPQAPAPELPVTKETAPVITPAEPVEGFEPVLIDQVDAVPKSTLSYRRIPGFRNVILRPQNGSS